MSDPYTLLPSGLDPTGGSDQTPSVLSPVRSSTFAAKMLRVLAASPLRLYSWGRGNLPRRFVDVLAGEFELFSRSMSDVALRAISESTYRAWEHPSDFPARAPQTLARGVVTLRAYAPLTQTETIEAGSLFGSADGRTARSEVAVTFPAGASSVDVPVVSEVPGAAGNFLAGQLNQMLSGRLGYPCSNAAAISGGREAESDEQMRVRFQDYVTSRATANRLSLFAAAMNARAADPVNPSLSLRAEDAAVLLPWTGGALNSELSYGYVVLDGGGGQVPSGLLEAAQTAVTARQAAGDVFTVIPVNPWVVTLDVVVAVSLRADLAAVRNALNAAWVTVAATRLIEDGRGRGRLPLFDLQRELELCHPDVVTVKILNQAGDLQPPRGARLLPGVLTAELRPGGVL